MDAWRWLKCPHCKAKLERKNCRYMMSLNALLLVGIVLDALLGRRYILLADALIVVIVAAMFVLLAHPQLQVRKPPPQPDTTLNIGDPAQTKK